MIDAIHYFAVRAMEAVATVTRSVIQTIAPSSGSGPVSTKHGETVRLGYGAPKIIWGVGIMAIIPACLVGDTGPIPVHLAKLRSHGIWVLFLPV